MSDVAAVPFPSSAWVDAIPVVWVEPHTGGARRLDPGKPDAYAQAFYDTLNRSRTWTPMLTVRRSASSAGRTIRTCRPTAPCGSAKHWPVHPRPSGCRSS